MTDDEKKIRERAMKHLILKGSGIDPYDLNVEDVAIQNIELKEEMARRRQKYRFENDVLIITLLDGTPKTIDLSTRRGSKQMRDLFEMLFDYWRKNGETESGWIKVVVPRNEIRKFLSAKRKETITDRWINDTASNIRKSKIRPNDLEGYIVIGEFDKKQDGYPFKIKSVA